MSETTPEPPAEDPADETTPDPGLGGQTPVEPPSGGGAGGGAGEG